MCQRRLKSSICWCHKVRFFSICPSCSMMIYKDDCLKPNGSSGFMHTKCPNENAGERVIRTIEAGFSQSIDYGSSFLCRLTTDGEQRLLPSPLCLDFDKEEDDMDTKMPAENSSKSDDDGNSLKFDGSSDEESGETSDNESGESDEQAEDPDEEPGEPKLVLMNQMKS